jgi:hypothetical protein
MILLLYQLSYTATRSLATTYDADPLETRPRCEPGPA